MPERRILPPLLLPSTLSITAEKPGRSRGFEPYAGRGERPGRSERTPATRSDPGRSEAGRGREAGRGGSEKGGGSGQFNPLIFLYLTFRFSLIVNSVN